MATPGAHKINGYWIIPAHDGGGLSKAIKSWTLSGSNDGFSTSTLLHSVTNQSFNTTTVAQKQSYVLYQTPVLYRDFRITVTAIQGVDTSVLIYKMGLTLNGTDICYNMEANSSPAPNVVSASHTSGGWLPYTAFHADDALSWMADWDGGPEWLQYSFGNPIVLSVVPNEAALMDSVVLTGEGFGDEHESSFVTFVPDNVESYYTSWSDTSITCPVPPSLHTLASGIYVTNAYTPMWSNTIPFELVTHTTETVTSKAKVHWLVKHTETSKALILQRHIKTETSEADVKKTTTRTLTGKTDVTDFRLTAHSLTAKAWVPTHIADIVPDHAPIGAPVTISGSGFGDTQGEEDIAVICYEVADVVSWSGTEIVCKVVEGVPFGVGFAEVITTEAGESNHYAFTVDRTPYITSLSPDHASRGGTVTIDGYSFGAAQGEYGRVIIGSIAADIVSWSDKEIVCTVGMDANYGTIPMEVMTDQGESNFPNFNVDAPTFTITATQGSPSHGTLDPSGVVLVDFGEGVLFTINSESEDWTFHIFIDGEDIGTVGSYLFTDVRGNHTLGVSWVERQTTIVQTLIAKSNILIPTIHTTRTLTVKSNILIPTIHTTRTLRAKSNIENSSFSTATPKLANVTWNGDGVISGKYMDFNPDETKWVVLGELLESFMDSTGSLPENITINSTRSLDA